MTHRILRLRSIPHEDELSIKIVRGAGHYPPVAAADLRGLGLGEQSQCGQKCCPDHHNQGGLLNILIPNHESILRNICFTSYICNFAMQCLYYISLYIIDTIDIYRHK